jgi:membrane-associated phospholipid phosphatase
MRSPEAARQLWLVSLLVCAGAVALVFPEIDLRIARRVYGIFGPLDDVANGLGSAVLLTCEAMVVLMLVVLRFARGPLTGLHKAIALACLTSICAYGINASVLKVLFGVPNPAHVLHGARHSFNWFHGSPDSSFPSGHLVLAGAFCGVMMRLYRDTVLPAIGLLVLAAGVLVAGDWHFLSDVIAGTSIGASVGLLAGELWLAHSH